ncbi:hypothetical protein BC832DRAFT_16258 [Gaertneriomyces semiglobifer]|nr:hypothetical protein BC832DRAFT_16258 [Gaertneriomyces semiglobifer]
MSFAAALGLLPIAAYEGISTVFSAHSFFSLCPSMRQKSPYLTRSGRIAIAGVNCLRLRKALGKEMAHSISSAYGCSRQKGGKRGQLRPRSMVPQQQTRPACTVSYGDAGRDTFGYAVENEATFIPQPSRLTSRDKCARISRDGNEEQSFYAAEIRRKYLSDQPIRGITDLWYLIARGQEKEESASEAVLITCQELDLSELRRLIALLKRHPHPGHAFARIKALHHAMRQLGAPLTADDLKALVWVCAKRLQRLRKAMKLALDYEKSGYPEPNIYVWKVLYDASFSRDPSKGRRHQEVLEEMLGKKWVFDHKTVLELLQCHKGRNDLPGALQLYEWSLSHSVKPTVCILETLLVVACRAGDLNAARDIADQVRCCGLKMTIAMLNSLLAAHLKAGEYPQGWIDQLAEYGDPYLRADTMTILLRALVRTDVARDLGSFADRLLRRPGFIPDRLFFSALLDHCMRCHNLTEAKRIATIMKQFNIELDASLYGTLVRISVESADFAQAEALMVEMRSRGIQPSKHMLTRIIDGYLRIDDLPGAIRVHQEISHIGGSQESHGGSKPDAHVMAIFLNYFRRMKDREGALRAFITLRKAGIRPNAAVYTILMSLFVDDNEAVRNLWADMKNCGVRPDAGTFIPLFRAAYRSPPKEVDVRVQKLWLEMETFDVRPTPYIFNIIMKGHTKMGRFANLKSLFESLQNHGLRPTSTTYNIMIQQASRANDVPAIEAYLQQMQEDNHTPDESTLAAVIDTMAAHGRWSDVAQYSDRLQAASTHQKASTGTSPQRANTHSKAPGDGVALGIVSASA